MAGNKVNWGLAASAWGKVTVGTDNKDIYGPPIKFVGNRGVNFTASGEMVPVYADGTIILVGKQNSGYTGTLELTSLDDEFAEWVLSENKDANNVQFETIKALVNRFYLLWEWEQDLKNTRHVMYNIAANRPNLDSPTAGDGGSKSAQNRTLNMTATPRISDGFVKAFTRADVSQAVYDNWFNSVYVPTAAASYALTIAVTDSATTPAPLPGAMVALSNGLLGYTDDLGQVAFFVVPGTYDVMASKAGFTAKVDSAVVAATAVTKAIKLATK